MPIYKTSKIKDGKTQYRVCVNYTDRQGNYRQKTKLIYGASEAKYAELQLQHEISQSKPDSAITVKQLYDEYIKSKASDVRVTTLNKNKSILTREVLPILGDMRLDKLNTKTLQAWKNTVSERKLSIVTKQHIYNELNALINYAVRLEYIAKNPLTNIGNFKEAYFTTAHEKLHYYTVDQFKKFISVAEECSKAYPIDWGYYVFFNVAFYTGMRKGEINALKWTDIEGDIIHVRRSIAQKEKGGDIETPPKNRSSYRDLQMPKQLSEILAEHKKRQMKSKSFKEDWRVCGGERCLRDTSLSNKNIQYAKTAGLPHIRIHDFRHTHATLLVNEGINIQEIARRLGHSNVQITWSTYAHLYPREEERAVKILENI